MVESISMTSVSMMSVSMVISWISKGAEVLGHGPGPHDAGGVDDVVQGDVPAVLDVLDLLPVPGRLLEGLDDEGGGGGHHGHGGLTVLDLELHGDLEALPVRR